MAAVGAVFRQYRLRRGMTQEQLEALSGLKQSYISTLERDETRDPSFTRVSRLLRAMGVSVDQFIEDLLSAEADDTAALLRPVVGW